MTNLNEEFLLAWSSLLCSNASPPGWQVISLPSAGTVGISAGKRCPENMESALLYFPSSRLARAERLPEGRGFTIERANIGTEPGLSLALTRQNEGDPELFASMVFDVVGAINEASSAGKPEDKLLRILIGRVVAWQRFMSRGTLMLGHEAELGLMGELHILKTLLDMGGSEELILEGWVGPLEAPQDFLLGGGGIEVKSTLSHGGLSLKIGSLEQLDDSTFAPLFLAAVRFSLEDSGFTLPEMVSEIEQRLGHGPDLFRERLLHAGYMAQHAPNYSRRFDPKEILVFSVSEGFPRLTSATVPAGVTRTVYEINMNLAKDFFVSMEQVLSKLGVIQ